MNQKVLPKTWCAGLAAITVAAGMFGAFWSSSARAEEVTVTTIQGDSDRGKFEADVKTHLTKIDSRIQAITSLYENGKAEDKDRLSLRMKVVTTKRPAIDADMETLKVAAGSQWTIIRGDVAANMELMERALDDLEFVFKHP